MLASREARLTYRFSQVLPSVCRAGNWLSTCSVVSRKITQSALLAQTKMVQDKPAPPPALCVSKQIRG